MAENEDNTTMTWEKKRRQMISPGMRVTVQLGRTGVVENVILTILLGHICVCNPRLVLRDSKKIANYRPGRRSRWIRQPSPSSAVAKGNKEVKEEGDGKGVNAVDE
jgi:hypothetical protein